MWLVKTDVNGIALWNQSFGGTGDQTFGNQGYVGDPWFSFPYRDGIYALLQTTDGGFAVAGTLNDFNLNECTIYCDMYLVKIKPTESAGGPTHGFALFALLASLLLLTRKSKHQK